MLEQITNGLFTGSIYALFAIGFTLVFGILRQLNLAHASIFTAGAFIAIGLIDGGTPAWLTFVLVAIAGVIVGLCLEFVAFRPLTGRPDEHFAGLISSVAFGGMVIALLRAYFGSEPRSIPADTLPATNWEFAGITVTFVQVLILTVSLVLMVTVHRRDRGSRFGRDPTTRRCRIVGSCKHLTASDAIGDVVEVLVHFLGVVATKRHLEFQTQQ